MTDPTPEQIARYKELSDQEDAEIGKMVVALRCRDYAIAKAHFRQVERIREMQDKLRRTDGFGRVVTGGDQLAAHLEYMVKLAGGYPPFKPHVYFCPDSREIEIRWGNDTDYWQWRGHPEIETMHARDTEAVIGARAGVVQALAKAGYALVPIEELP